MQYPLCDCTKPYEHKRTSQGSQRFLCPQCQTTFIETFDTLYYRRQFSEQEVHTILQSHCEGSSLRGVSRLSQKAYGTVVG
jgi:transposase-like protein